MSEVLLVGIDCSDCSERALEYAANWAAATGRDLIVAHVIQWSPFSFQTPQENEERHRRREAELERALRLQSRLIGVNNRNLKTLKTDTNTTKQLAGKLPDNRLLICESGLNSATDLADMAGVGARCFLIGEALMREPDVEQAVIDILADPVPPKKPIRRARP